MRKDVAKINPTTSAGKNSVVEVGQWYWVKSNDEEENGAWLGCVMHIGSNFVELDSPHSQWDGNYHVRVHFNEFHNELRREHNPQTVIHEQIAKYQAEAVGYLQEIKEITGRLGLAPALVDQSAEANNALVVMSEKPDINAYKKSLIKAKDKTLPELFKKVEKAHKQVAKWMAAETLPLLAQTEGLDKHIEQIGARIFNVSLYAGLAEQVVECKKGTPAERQEKLHVMQRKLYMDEECLLNYEHGGMEFGDIKHFDKWLSRKENIDRVLPFPRTLVAMQVRRKAKEREEHSLDDRFVNIRLENDDKLTFLYIRNGEQLYRMDCELDFDTFIFPDKSIFDPDQLMMMKIWGDKIREIITRGEWEGQVAANEEQLRKYKEFKRTHKKDEHNPFWSTPYHNVDDYEPFDPSSVYYDEGTEYIKKQMEYYNRIALIVQGLFDRSPVLHPHAPVRTWEPEGFDAAIKLVRDGDMVLAASEEPPDFEAYRKQLNANMNVESIVTGQELAWMCREAVRENEKQARNWRIKNPSHYKTYRPYGDPGPGFVSTMSAWKKNGRKAVFRWTRERQGYRRYSWDKNQFPCSIVVPADELFNVSAYKPGDYKQFFNDPRTRANYLKWAPMLLAAEEYHAGNVMLGRGSNREWIKHGHRTT